MVLSLMKFDLTVGLLFLHLEREKIDKNFEKLKKEEKEDPGDGLWISSANKIHEDRICAIEYAVYRLCPEMIPDGKLTSKRPQGTVHPCKRTSCIGLRKDTCLKTHVWPSLEKKGQ